MPRVVHQLRTLPSGHPAETAGGVVPFTQGVTITTLVGAPVLLGTGRYTASLAVAATGGIEPEPRYVGYDVSALRAKLGLANIYVLNQGNIIGAGGGYGSVTGAHPQGYYGLAAGDGIDFTTAAGAVIVNQGNIAAGFGVEAFRYTYAGGAGGVGIALGADATLTNGTSAGLGAGVEIAGGYGGFSLHGTGGQVARQHGIPRQCDQQRHHQRRGRGIAL